MISELEEVGQQTLVLASQSPRRRELLTEAGFDFAVVTPRYEEPVPSGWRLHPEEYAESVSYFKARSLAEEFPNRVILGADTVVALGDWIFGKPTDVDDARRILSSLMGTRHKVITGISIIAPDQARRRISHAVTKVTMRDMNHSELEAYLKSGEWEGKAGAYGIQDIHDQYIEKLEGSFSNVMGLPMELVTRMLAEFGIYPNRQEASDLSN